MKILTYSDLHLEFGALELPEDLDGDVMLLGGDILPLNINGEAFQRLLSMLRNWTKPVFMICGNHEFYTRRQMEKVIEEFRQATATLLPQLELFDNENLAVINKNGRVNLFGGTMWTNFNNANPLDILTAHNEMNDYVEIKVNDPEGKRPNGLSLTPYNTMEFHEQYKNKLIQWFETVPRDVPCVVMSHHAPVQNPGSYHYGGKREGAYVSLDMIPIIEQYQPDLWIYGHTHDCHDIMIGKTRIISNPRGYAMRGYLVPGFDLYGKPIEL